ncbi:hypothetical protein QL285_092189 [Trifolium repens]|nr:hypothetical protein QL285_092189 [Trifolium repens]
MSYLSILVAFLSVITLTISQNIIPKHPNIGLISHQPPTTNLQKPVGLVGLKYSPPGGPNQHPPPPPPPPFPIYPPVTSPPIRIPIIPPKIPHLHSRKSRRHTLRPPPKM